MVQTVDGWARLQAQTKRFSRTVANEGAVTDDLIAWAYTEAELSVFNLILESDTDWTIRSKVIDDTADSFGTKVEANAHRYLIETDLGITDLAKVKRLYRVDPNNSLATLPIHHLSNQDQITSVQGLGSVNASLGMEAWVEDGAANADGDHELAIVLFNRTTGMSSGHLKVQYYFYPPAVTPTTFTTVDTSGNLTKKPTLPRMCWPAILNYAHLIILETIEDDYKARSLWKRMNGPEGVLGQARKSLSTFQTGEPDYPANTYDTGAF